MELQELLGEEIYQQVQDKLGDSRIAIISDGNWIPKAKFDEVNIEKNGYKDQIGTLNQELGKLKGQLETNGDANQTIEDLQKDIKDKEVEMAALRKVNAIKFEVLKANPNDVADILPQLDNESITLKEDGTVEGLKEQLDNLKENKAYLFKEVEPQGTGGSLGAGIKGIPNSDNGTSLQSIMEKASIRNN